MNNKQSRILIWGLAWAGLFVAVLYSPVGSPDMYTPSTYFQNSGVDFSTTTIQNASSGRYSGSDNLSSFEMTVGIQQGANYLSYSPTSMGVSTSSNGFYGFSSQRNQSSTGVSQFGGSGMIAGKASGKGSNSGSGSAIGMASNLNSSSMFEGSSNRQSAPYTPNSGATDPGEDPTGNPIPVGDGLPFLLVLVAIYVGWKKLIVS